MTPVQTLARRAMGTGAASLAALGMSLGAPAASASPAAASPAPAAAKAAPAAAKAAPAAAQKGMVWVDVYDEALARAKKEKKLVLLDFYTDWCGWCKRLDRDVFSQQSFITAADGVIACKINAEKRPDLAMRYQVSSYPKLFFLNSDGVTIERIKGYLSLDDFTNRVTSVKSGDTEYTRLRQDAMDPMNLPAIYRFARYLSDDRQHEAGIQYWQQVHDLSLQQLFENPTSLGPMNYHREALVELGRGYEAAGIEEAARRQFDEVLRVYPDNPMSAADALVGLARLELKKPSGQAKAAQFLDKVLTEYPGTPAVAEAARLKQSLQVPVATAK